MEVNKKHVRQGTVLFRSETNKIVGGVCGGLAETFNIDPTIVRALFAIAFLFGGSGLLLYFILWIIIPSESKVSLSSEENIHENIEELKDRAKNFSQEFTGKNKNSKKLFGVVLLILGVMFLAENFGFGDLFNFHRFWPVILIVLGFFVIVRQDH